MFPQRPSPARIAWLAVFGMLALLVTPDGSQAQPSFTVTFGSTFDSFKPTATDLESRQNLMGAANAEHRFADERGRVFYDLDGGEYDSPGDWSFFQHNAGLSYRFGGTEPESRALYFTASAVARRNGDAWTSAEYEGVGAGVNAEFHPFSAGTLRAGYRADYRRFADYAALTQLEQRTFASALRSFASRTTLVGEVQLGVKHYDGTIISDLTVPAAGAVTPAGGRGYGMGMGSSMRVVNTPAHTISTQEGAAGLVSGLARLAQSLSDRTGLHVQGEVRRTFGTVPPALVTTPAGFFEDGVYDDPFASNGFFLQAGVKHAFASGAEIAATTWWADKQFTGTVALGADGLDAPGSPLRADTANLTQVAWTQPLLASKTGAVTLSADIGYRFLRQRSNDVFYNYTSHALAIGFSVGY